MKKNILKKILVIILVTILVIIRLISIVFIALMFFLLGGEYDWEKKDGWSVACNKLTGKCYVAEYMWDGDKNSMELTVPEEINRKSITRLGGYDEGSHSFGVFFDDKLLEGNDDEWSIMEVDIEPTDNDYETFRFIIHIGENIKKVENTFGPYYYLSGEDDTVYKVDYYFECSKENDYLYSKDGVLYSKDDDKPYMY